jgi:hypothetical protein
MVSIVAAYIFRSAARPPIRDVSDFDLFERQLSRIGDVIDVSNSVSDTYRSLVITIFAYSDAGIALLYSYRLLAY